MHTEQLLRAIPTIGSTMARISWMDHLMWDTEGHWRSSGRVYLIWYTEGHWRFSVAVYLIWDSEGHWRSSSRVYLIWDTEGHRRSSGRVYLIWDTEGRWRSSSRVYLIWDTEGHWRSSGLRNGTDCAVPFLGRLFRQWKSTAKRHFTFEVQRSFGSFPHQHSHSQLYNPLRTTSFP